MRSILDSKFRYTPSSSTDLRATFKKIERARAKAWDNAHAENAARDQSERNQKVRQIGGGN